MNSGPIAKLRQNITTIMAAVSVAAVAIPAARAAELDLVSALRDQGAQIVPLGPRGGLAGYLVTPVGGAGYSLYVTNDGHGVAGLLYGPDGVLITGAQLAAVRGENRPAGTAPNPLPMLAPRGAAPVAPGEPGGRAARVRRYRDRAAGRCFHDECTWRSGLRDPVVPLEVATRDYGQTASPGRPCSSVPRPLSAFTLGERGPLVVLFGDPLLSMVALGRRADRPRGDGRQAAAACRAGGAVGRGFGAPRGGDRRKFQSDASLVRTDRWSIRRAGPGAYRGQQCPFRCLGRAFRAADRIPRHARRHRAPRRRHRRSRYLAAGTRR